MPTEPTPTAASAPPAWTLPLPTPSDSFATGLLAATGVAALGVLGWVVAVEALHVQTALIGFGVAVGTTAAFRRFAPQHPLAPVAVVGLTIASAVLGLLASQYALLAEALHVSYFSVVSAVPLSKLPRLITVGTDALTWVIVALSAYSGYRASVRLRMQAGPGRVPYGAPASPDPTLQDAAFAELRAANATARDRSGPRA